MKQESMLRAGEEAQQEAHPPLAAREPGFQEAVWGEIQLTASGQSPAPKTVEGLEIKPV